MGRVDGSLVVGRDGAAMVGYVVRCLKRFLRL